MKKLADSIVIVCGIVRNAEKGLKKNIPIINDFVSHCKDFRVFVYENDSIDKTKNILLKWRATDEQRIIVSLNNNDSSKTIPSYSNSNKFNPFYSHKRIDKMARLRNNYMCFIDNIEMVADYVVIVDLDVAQLCLDGILSSFDSTVEWDAVCANGYSLSPKLRNRYHDTYALTLWEERDQPQTEQKIHKYSEYFGNLDIDSSWVRIASGFGGLAIYKYEAIKGLFYTEPAIENDDIRVEVKCEHFSLYKQMMERGYIHFYINPAMKLKYQNVTLRIVLNSVLRNVSDFLKRGSKHTLLMD